MVYNNIYCIKVLNVVHNVLELSRTMVEKINGKRENEMYPEMPVNSLKEPLNFDLHGRTFLLDRPFREQWVPNNSRTENTQMRD